MTVSVLLCAALLGGCPGSDSEAPGGSAGVMDANGASQNGAGVKADDGLQEVVIHGRVFRLELALDEAARIQGLSDRASIEEDGGMLFVFPDEQRRSFVMRRCLVPIDIAFLNARGEVVWMHAMQVESDPDTPEYRLKRYDSHYPSQFAIELRDGTLRELGLKQGEVVGLPLAALKARAR